MKEYLKSAAKISQPSFLRKLACHTAIFRFAAKPRLQNSRKPKFPSSLHFKGIFLSAACAIILASCAGKGTPRADAAEMQRELEALLLQPGISSESRFAITNKIATKMLSDGNFYDLILYLTNYVETNGDDEHDSYWLLMCA